MDLQQNPQVPITPVLGGADQEKVLLILGYVFPVLFFLPLVIDSMKNSQFAKFHANQQLNLLLFGVIGWAAAVVLTIILIGVLLIPILGVAELVFAVMGVINVLNKEMKPLPLIGQFTLIK